MRILMTAAAAAVLMSAAVSGHAFAATAQQSKMQQCAAQWQDLKKAKKTGGQDYKTFSAGCMKTATPAPVVAAAVAKPAATVATSGKMAQQDRMKACGAQWQDLKKANKTGGQTYKQFSSTCLKSK